MINKFDFLDIQEMKKSPSTEVMGAINYMSNYLANKALNSSEMDDLEFIANKHMASDLYDNPQTLDEIFVLNDILIGVPNIKPIKNHTTGMRKNGTTVVPLIHIPGKQPYYSWDATCPTYKEKFELSLRGGRVMTIHNVIPGMKVSFHFFNYCDGMKNRVRISGKYIDYDEENKIVISDLDESDVAVRMPDWD